MGRLLETDFFRERRAEAFFRFDFFADAFIELAPCFLFLEGDDLRAGDLGMLYLGLFTIVEPRKRVSHRIPSGFITDFPILLRKILVTFNTASLCSGRTEDTENHRDYLSCSNNVICYRT